jgi:hypothetical protein
MSDDHGVVPRREIVGYLRTKLPVADVEGPSMLIFRGDELDKTRAGREIVGWIATKLAGTDLAGPGIPIYLERLAGAAGGRIARGRY